MRLLRAYERLGAHGPKWLAANKPRFEVKAAADTLELTIAGFIGDDGWSENPITFDSVKRAADAAGQVRNIHVTLNSPGGYTDDGIGIYNLLRSHQAKVTIDVVAMAASSASLILMAGDERIVHQGSLVMIHPPWGITMGSASDHQKTAELLDKLQAEMCAIYAQRTGLTPAKCEQMVMAETWMTTKDAVDQGFADRIVEGKTKPEEPSAPPEARATAKQTTARASALAQLGATPIGTLRSNV